MAPVKRRSLLVVLVLAMLLAPGTQAEDPADAPAAWRAQFGEDGVASLVFTPDPLPLGQQFQARLAMLPEAGVSEVRYQVCYIGLTCFAIGVPARAEADSTWVADAADINDHQGSDREWQADALPATALEDTRIGVQFFVCRHPSCIEDVFNDTAANGWDFFPHGDECDPVNDTDAEWQACQETHYFGVNVVAADKAAPSPGVAVALAVLVATSLLMRRRV